MGNSRLVYSTETGRICSECEKPALNCACKKKTAEKTPPRYPNDGIVRIKREVKGRKGKTVTVVYGLLLDGERLKQFARTLKHRCGTGGTVKDGIIVIQGDHRATAQQAIEQQGYTVKLAGG